MRKDVSYRRFDDSVAIELPMLGLAGPVGKLQNKRTYLLDVMCGYLLEYLTLG